MTRALVLALLVACGSSSRPELALERIEPAYSTNTVPVPVMLDGTFQLEVQSDLDDNDFTVPALEVLVGDTPLDNVSRDSESLITGTIPAGLPPGRYDVIVRNGSRTSVLPGGYAVVASALTSTISIPALIGRGNTFAVTMKVTNAGTMAATGVLPEMLVASGTGTAMLAMPPASGVDIAGGASTTFTFTYTAQTVGTFVLSGNASGVDAESGFTIASPVTSSNMADIVEATSVIDDPLGDGSTFGYVAGYRGRVYIGPNDSGSSASRMEPDATGLEQLSFTFARDTVGNQSASSSSPYTSIGATGCQPNTSCGPDNEDGRGLFASGTLGGTEWLILGGARDAGDLDYIYMTSDDDTTLDFRYVDLSEVLGPQTRGISAMHVHEDRLYIGFPDSGGARPYLVALVMSPSTAPGLDAALGTDVVNLGADDFPGWQASTPAMVDSFATLNGLLYTASAGGIMASTVTSPRAYGAFPSDWASATPAFLPYINRPSRTTMKLADLEPRDRAVPQMAAFGGQLFMARNTTSGPQLWACNPAPGNADRCEPGDWRLVAPNLSGDILLTQFDNPALTSITMLVATPQWLYVGFDGSGGATVFRTANPNATVRSDFQGEGGCSAAQHPATCNGIGGQGFGTPTDTRIFDAKALTFGTATSVWITAGDATSPARLVMLP